MAKLSGLMQLLHAAAKRRGYAATNDDQVAALEKLYARAPVTFEALRPERVVDEIAYSTNNPRSNTKLILTTPESFMKAALPRDRYQSNEDQIAQLSRMLRNRESLPEADGGDFYYREFPEFTGFGDIPRLFFANKTEGKPLSRIWGHEGRHRMEAIRDVYGDVPIGIEAYTGDYKNLDEMLKAPFTRNEADTDFILTPEKLAKGGLVRYKECA